jgi:hypothetical protein
MASNFDLCKLEDVKEWANAKTPSVDELLGRLITATSRDFMTAVNRHDLTPVKTYIEVVTIDRRNPEGFSGFSNGLSSANKPIASVGLRHWPIQKVTSITIDGTSIVASDGTADGFFYDENEEDESRNTLLLIGSGTAFNRSVLATVVYDAGYDSVPEDIEQAVIEWVAFRYSSRQWIGQVAKHSIQGEAVQYSQQDMPATTKAVIERYSRTEELL